MHDKIKIIKEKTAYILEGIPKEKLILGASLVFLTAFLLFQSLIAQQLRRLKAIDYQFACQRKLLDFYYRLMKNEDFLVDEAEGKEKALDKIKERFILEEERSNYFAEFRDLAKSYNLEVVSLEFNPQESSKDSGKNQFNYFQRLPFDISIKGDYFNIMSLLYKLEQNKPIFEIKAIHIQAPSPQAPSVVIDMKAAIYILMQEI